MEALYVATDAHGVEHAPGGRVTWKLPDDGASESTADHQLVLRRPIALLEVLDERIFLARADDAGDIGADGAVTVDAAELVSETAWNTEVATRFALLCADHLLEQTGDRALPDGKSLQQILANARSVLDGVSSDAVNELGYLARLRALRRLKHERKDIADLSFATLLDDEAKDLDALDDPEYQTIAPITDAVLAAIEALRHHVVPKLFGDAEEDREEASEHRVLDRKRPLRVSQLEELPWGPIEKGGPHVTTYEPAWTSAREAARHVRVAMNARGGDGAERDELRWQADELERALTG